LSVGLHYQIGGGGGCRNLGRECVNFLCKLMIFMLANSCMKDDKFAEESNATINELIFPPKFLKMAAKISPLTFSIVYMV